MSRVGKNPVNVPNNVSVKISQLEIIASGKFGEISLNITKNMKITQENNQIWVDRSNLSKKNYALWGTTRANIENMITGVSKGFTKELEISGVGYRAHIEKNQLILQLGFSHEVRVNIPKEIQVTTKKPNAITIFGPDKTLIGQFAANIRNFKKPEPYKGKGIRYKNEYILRKEGKKK